MRKMAVYLGFVENDGYDGRRITPVASITQEHPFLEKNAPVIMPRFAPERGPSRITTLHPRTSNEAQPSGSASVRALR